MIQAVAVQFGRKLLQKDVLKISIAGRSKYLCQNAITGVQLFQHRIEAFFFEYLLSDAHPLGHASYACTAFHMNEEPLIQIIQLG